MDGKINATDQRLIQNAILERTTLGTVRNIVVSTRSVTDSVPFWEVWQQGLCPSNGVTDSDGDGVSDATELRNGTDPLNPDSLVPYGTYVARPSVQIYLPTLNPQDAGVFVAKPPTSIYLPTLNPEDAGLFAAKPPTSIYLPTLNPQDAGAFVATPPVTIYLPPKTKT